MTAPAVITVDDLTTAALDGTGMFDVLMRANKAHLDAEFANNRIRGPEYAQVYLGSLQALMSASVQFLIQKQKSGQEALLLEQQILLAQVEVAKATASLAQIEAQTIMIGQQTTNLLAEAANIPKQTALLENQALKLVQDTLLTIQQTANAVIEGTVLTGQKCKLDAEFDVLQNTNLKTVQETALMLQKVATEKAQTTALGVDDNSVVGKQKLLYAAQTNGFTRDAEQKVADIMVKTWSTRRMTDEATSANTTNKLDDTAVGRAVTSLLAGVGA